MATHFSTLAREGDGYPRLYSCLNIPGTQEPDGLQSKGLDTTE